MIQISLILTAVLSRIVPHFPNVTAVGATTVMAGRHLSKGRAIMIVLTAMLISDFLLSQIHGYPFVSWVTPFVYGSLIASLFISFALRNKRAGAFAATLCGTLLFYVISNFGVWFSGALYQGNVRGLTECYAMALPFLRTSLIGDLLWTTALTLTYKAYVQFRAAHQQPAH